MIQQLVDQKHPTACYVLGVWKLEGMVGQERKPADAIKLFEQAGTPEALRYLGMSNKRNEKKRKEKGKCNQAINWSRLLLIW